MPDTRRTRLAILRSSRAGAGGLVLVAASLFACRRSDPRTYEADAGASVGSSSSSGANLGSLPLPRALCPLTIEPGVSFGPVTLGESLSTLEDTGLVVTRFSGDRAELVIPGADGPSIALKVSLCAGKVVQVWIDDLRRAPDCVVFQGQTLSRTAPRDDLERTFGGCLHPPVRSGRPVARCQEGGVLLDPGSAVGPERQGSDFRVGVALRALPADGGCPP